MYLVYESCYGELVIESDESTCIIALYDSLEKAKNKVKELIENQLKDEERWVLDEEKNDIDRDNYVRLFWHEQENWNCYYEILIKKLEVE